VVQPELLSFTIMRWYEMRCAFLLGCVVSLLRLLGVWLCYVNFLFVCSHMCTTFAWGCFVIISCFIYLCNFFFQWTNLRKISRRWTSTLSLCQWRDLRGSIHCILCVTVPFYSIYFLHFSTTLVESNSIMICWYYWHYSVELLYIVQVLS
jgi:hypothetical protein